MSEATKKEKLFELFPPKPTRKIWTYPNPRFQDPQKLLLQVGDTVLISEVPNYG